MNKPTPDPEGEKILEKIRKAQRRELSYKIDQWDKWARRTARKKLSEKRGTIPK